MRSNVRVCSLLALSTVTSDGTRSTERAVRVADTTTSVVSAARASPSKARAKEYKRANAPHR